MDQIIVGMDGSAVAGDALEWAAAIAGALGAQIRAVNAFQNPFSEVSPDTQARLIAEREAELDSWIAAAQTNGATVVPVVKPGDPREVILSEADSANADLVVLGRTGAGGGPGFLHLGSVVEHAAHHCATPLAVLPPGFGRPPQRVVVGVDGSPGSLAAVGFLVSISTLGPMVSAVRVADPGSQPGLGTSGEDWRRDTEGEIEAWTAPLHDAGLAVSPIPVPDLPPADALLGIAAGRHADLLVVGARGLGGFSGLRAGGTALKVLHRAALPMVLVPTT